MSKNNNFRIQKIILAIKQYLNSIMSEIKKAISNKRHDLIDDKITGFTIPDAPFSSFFLEQFGGNKFRIAFYSNPF